MYLKLFQPDLYDSRASSASWFRDIQIWLSRKNNRLSCARVWITCMVIPVVMTGFIPSTVSATGLPPWLQASRVSDAIVSVRSYKNDRLLAEGAGMVINNEGYVLTSAAVLDAGSRFTVIASGNVELAADVELNEKDSGLGVLRAEGLSSTGLPLSTERPASGVRIFAVPPEIANDENRVIAGAVSDAEVRTTSGGEIGVLRHNAIITARWYGSPAIDECGRVIGLNIPNPQAISLFRAPRNIEPKDVVFAVRAGDIASVLVSLGIEFVQEEEACVSAQTRAQQRAHEAQQAQERVRQAEEEVRIAGEQVQQAQSHTESAQEQARFSREARQQAQREAERARQEALQADQRARQAESEAERAETQLDEAHKRLEEARKSSEKLKKLAIWGGAIGILLLISLLASWISMVRRRKHEISLAQARAERAEQEAGEAKRRVDEITKTAPFDCVLTGIDDAGSPLALSIRREALGDPAGVVIGRSPAGSVHVVANPSVSREHARICVEQGIPYVEDLNSTNGSTLNGHVLLSGERSRISDGDELKLGSVSFRIHLKS